MQERMEHTRFTAYILTIIRIPVREKTYQAKGNGLNTVFGIMEALLTGFGLKKRKS